MRARTPSEADLLPAARRRDQARQGRSGSAVGCAECHGEGYRGRAGLYEVVAVDEKFQKLIHDGASEAELEAYARKDNPSLLDDGIAKVKAGVTTVQEVARVTKEES